MTFIFEDLNKPNGVIGTTEFGLLYYEFKETSVFQSVREFDSEKCYYLVESLGGIKSILNAPFTTTMSEKTIELIKSNKCKLIVSSMSEGNLEHDDLIRLHKILKDTNIPPSNVYLIQSNYNLKKQYDNLFQLDRINLITTEHKLESAVEGFRDLNDGRWNYDDYPQRPSINTWDEVQKIKDVNREYFFISYNKTLRPDRVALLSLLYKNDLIKKGLVSIGSKDFGSTGKQTWPDTFDFIKDNKEDVRKWSTKLQKLQPLSIDGEPKVEKLDEGKYKGLNVCGYTYGEQFRKVYFMLVTEDVFNSESMFFSQTTYKPIVSLTPFIMFGSPYMMKTLREVQGFKTFSPWIDESYDEEENHEKRLMMIVEEVKRLCQSKQDIHRMYYEMKDVLIYNKKHLLNYEFNDFKKIRELI